MGSPARRGSAQLLLLFACLHLSAVKSLDVSPPTPAPAPAAVASPFSFSFDFTNASSYRLDDLKLEGDATIPLGRGLVDVTCNSWGKDPTSCKGRVSYGHPVPFYDTTTGEVASFQTRFTFTINTTKNKGDGMAFFLAYYPSALPPNSTGGHLGLISEGDQERGAALGNQQFVAVEFDTHNNGWDPPNTTADHIGIDINSVHSENTSFPRFSLNGSMTATVTFDNTTRMLVADLQLLDNQSYQPVQVSWQLPDPVTALLPAQVAVGFSAATGLGMELHQLLSWSFNSSLARPRKVRNMKPAIVGGSVGGAVALVIVGWCIISCFKWTRSTSHDFVVPTGGVRRFEYRDLAAATDNFSLNRVIGQGAFGIVYKGTFSEGSPSGAPLGESDVPSSKKSTGGGEVAVKKIKNEKILNDTRGGNQDFFAEIKTISEAKHKNLVELKGWCRRENNQNLLDFMCWCCRKNKDDELFLIYELVPNGDLDYHLFKSKEVLYWPERYQIVKDIGSALVYLHHDCHRPILHRDIKPGNVLLDKDFKAKLADFGLSRIGNKNKAAVMTTAVGTPGYMDPECMRDGKVEFHPRSDVYSFGIVLLNVVCTRKSREQVWELYQGGKVMEAADERLGRNDSDRRQMERVAVLGLWCSLPHCAKRPTIREAMEILERNDPFPDLNYLMSTSVPSAQQDTYTSTSDQQAVVSDIQMAARNFSEPHA